MLFTRDTHETAYLETQEGKNLPVPHCIRGSDGWELIPQLGPLAQGRQVLDKPTFGSAALERPWRSWTGRSAWRPSPLWGCARISA